MGRPAISSLSDYQFTQHLMLEHPADIRMRWNGSDRRLMTRHMHEVYHDYLHRTKNTGHEHEEGIMAARGWVQQTPCVCLDPPQHRDDCTGKRGTLVLADRHGPSLREIAWQELDDIMDRLMTTPAEDGRDPGRAEATAYLLAHMESPYKPDIQEIRAEAMRRWNERSAE